MIKIIVTKEKLITGEISQDVKVTEDDVKIGGYEGFKGQKLTLTLPEYTFSTKFSTEYITEKLKKIENAVKEINCKEIPDVVNQIVKDNILAIKKELGLLSAVAGAEKLMEDLDNGQKDN